MPLVLHINGKTLCRRCGLSVRGACECPTPPNAVNPTHCVVPGAASHNGTGDTLPHTRKDALDCGSDVNGIGHGDFSK